MDIINIQEWTEQWLNDMSLAVKNQDVHLRDVLLQEDVDSEIDWAKDANPLYSEYINLLESSLNF